MSVIIGSIDVINEVLLGLILVTHDVCRIPAYGLDVQLMD